MAGDVDDGFVSGGTVCVGPENGAGLPGVDAIVPEPDAPDGAADDGPPLTVAPPGVPDAPETEDDPAGPAGLATVPSLKTIEPAPL